MSGTLARGLQSEPERPALARDPVEAANVQSSDSPRLIAYPARGIAYCDELYRSLARMGVEAIEGHWQTGWILKNVARDDVVHVHWPSFYYYRKDRRVATLYSLLRFFVFLGFMRLKGARIVWTAHNLYPHAGGQSEWTHRVARRYLVRIVSTIFVHSAAAGRLVAAEFGVDPARMTRVPHGHWCTLYPSGPPRREARELLNLPQDAYLFGFIGACRPYKNLEALVRALPQVDDRCHLLIAGEFASPEYLAAVRALIPTSCSHRVHIVNRFLYDAEIMTFVAATDAMVLPYKEILTSGGVMLGMSGGVPVVAPKLGGIPEVIDERTGVLYDPSAADGLGSAMRAVRDRPFSSDEIIRRAQRFDWNESARALLELIRRAPT